MANVTIRALKVDDPGNSLATWLAAHHPDLFLAVFKKAQAANLRKGIQKLGVLAMGRLGDDGVTTTFDDTPSSFDSSPAFSDPGLTSVTFDPSSASLPSNLISDSTSGGSSFLSSVGDGLTSAGSTVADALGSAGTSVLGALGSVGSFLSSATGLNTVAGLAKSYFGAQAASSTAQTQQAVAQAQIARAATGQAAAPITYTTNAQGQLVPVYATNTPSGTVYQPLSPQGIASLTPSSVSVFLSKYGVWVALAALGILGVSLMRR